MAKTNAKNIVSSGHSVSMKIKQNTKGITDFVVTYYIDNTYSIMFYKNIRFGSTLVSSADNIQPNKLKEVFTQHTNIIL